MAPRPLWPEAAEGSCAWPAAAADAAEAGAAAKAQLGWAPPCVRCLTLEPLLELCRVWRATNQSERVGRLQQQILRSVNAEARRLLLGSGDYASAQPLLRGAEGLIAADASGSQLLPSAPVAETWELCSRALWCSSRRIPNEGAPRAAAARLRRAIQYDERIVLMSGRRAGCNASSAARAHARLACAHSELRQSDRARESLRALVQLASGGQVDRETIRAIGVSLREARSSNGPQLIAAAAAADAAEAAAAAEAGTTGATAAPRGGPRVAPEKAPRSAGKRRSPFTAASALRVAQGAPAATVAAASSRRSARSPGWDERQTVQTRIGVAAPPVPRPMYTSATERRAAVFGWRVGDFVQARQRESGQWLDAKIDAKRRKPGGGWYVVLSGSMPRRMRTDEIRPREKPQRGSDGLVRGAVPVPSKEQAHYRDQIEYGRQFLQDMEELFAFNTALKPERILRPDEQEAACLEAVGRLDEEDATKAQMAADAKDRIRYQATTIANSLIDLLITATLDAVEEQRMLQDEKFLELDVDASGVLTRHEMKAELLKRGIGIKVDDFIAVVESKSKHAESDGKIDRGEMAAALATIETAEKAEDGKMFFDEDSAQWKIHGQ